MWSGDGLKYHVVSAHDSIGEADEFRQRVTSEDRYWSMVSDLSEMIDGPASWELMDVIVAANRNGGMLPYSIRVSASPRAGQNLAMRDVLTEWTGHIQSTGVQTSLLQQVWGANGPVFSNRSAFESIGAADENRQSMMQTAEYRDFVGKMAPLMASNPAYEVNESLASAGM